MRPACAARVVPPEGHRHRQRTHGHSCPPRQGRPRSRCSVEPEAAGDSARVLALDEAQDLSVPRHGEQLAGRCAHHGEDRLGGRGRGREAMPASRSMYLRTRCGTASPLTCWKPAPICAPSRCCSDMPSSPTPTVYLHLSRRHLQAIPSPLEAIEVSSPDEVKRSRRLMKR